MSAAVTTKRQVYHTGDIVRIIEPLVVTRVGYPLTKQDALVAVESQYAQRIYDFIASLLNRPTEFVITETDPRLYNDLLDALASYWIRQQGYGGKERKIYTEPDEQLRSTDGWRVLSKRTVKTGTYCAGGYSSGWDGEPDYDPPYLSNEKSHVLLTLEQTDVSIGKLWRIGPLEIEAVNVERCPL